MDKTVATFRKNSIEEIRATLQEWKGRQLASLRLYYEDEAGERKPSPKGVTIPVALLPELVKAVHALRDAAVRAGLVEAEEFDILGGPDNS